MGIKARVKNGCYIIKNGILLQRGKKMLEEKNIFIKKLHEGLKLPTRSGAFYDLYIPQDVDVEAGGTVKIGLGFSCRLPYGYHATVLMRSSTWHKWGLCLTNQCGIIDSSYCGDGDEWILSVYRPRSFKTAVHIPAGTRLAQFTLEKDCPVIHWNYCQTLYAPDRGGFGSTGD